MRQPEDSISATIPSRKGTPAIVSAFVLTLETSNYHRWFRWRQVWKDCP